MIIKRNSVEIFIVFKNLSKPALKFMQLNESMKPIWLRMETCSIENYFDLSLLSFALGFG